tara:strand:+ start:1222 stop:1467 length:246 start_codon:yes stop_codon:yes gene_type:complete
MKNIFAYDIACHTLPSQICNNNSIVKVDYSPSLNFYGTIYLNRRLSEEEQEEFQLYVQDEESIAMEAKSEALYRNETGYQA